MDDKKEGIPSCGLTNEHDPAVSDLTYQTTVSEALDEQAECETSPSADEIP